MCFHRRLLDSRNWCRPGTDQRCLTLTTDNLSDIVDLVELLMKDYYDILGVPKDADTIQIKSAFRRLAFEYHPDKNPGNEQQAAERFKAVNEAYSVLGDNMKRRQYDAYRTGPFAGAAANRNFQGAYSSQEEVFRQAFADGSLFDDLNRMFAQGGLRFDADFLNRVFFSGQGVHVYYSGDPLRSRQGFGASWQSRDMNTSDAPRREAKKPNILERLLLKIQRKILSFLFKRAFGIDLNQPMGGGKTGTWK